MLATLLILLLLIVLCVMPAAGVAIAKACEFLKIIDEVSQELDDR
jgi:hypothetical protein